VPSLTIDRGTVDSVSRETGFRRGSVEKALRLVALLDEISRDRFLGPRVVLKGGTGLNLFYGGLRRLSIDADLDYIGAVDLAGMKAERPQVLTGIDEIGQALGYRVSRLKDGHAGAVTHFRYPSLTGGRDLVKVDLNFLERVPVLGRIERRAPNSALRFEGVKIPCLHLDELAGSKLATLCLRGLPRDLYDVANFGSLDLDAATVRKVALFHGFMADLDLASLDIDRASRVGATALRNKVQAMLSLNTPLDRDAVVEGSRQWTDALFPLQRDEERFKARLKEGIIEPRLLFGHIPVHARLAEHPGLLWRRQVKREQG
jgi:predicted nucleotidyltransferase component of viral defense system